jgi:hypothetical protein
VDFIQRFKCTTYPVPDEIIGREYDADTAFEDNFISLKLIIDGQGIIFADKPEYVQEQLVMIIGMIVNQSQNLPRPENTIARSDKMHLWGVEKDDEIVQISTAKISETIKENLDVVKLLSRCTTTIFSSSRRKTESTSSSRPQLRLSREKNSRPKSTCMRQPF